MTYLISNLLAPVGRLIGLEIRPAEVASWEEGDLSRWAGRWGIGLSLVWAGAVILWATDGAVAWDLLVIGTPLVGLILSPILVPLGFLTWALGYGLYRVGARLAVSLPALDLLRPDR